MNYVIRQTDDILSLVQQYQKRSGTVGHISLLGGDFQERVDKRDKKLLGVYGGILFPSMQIGAIRDSVAQTDSITLDLKALFKTKFEELQAREEAQKVKRPTSGKIATATAFLVSTEGHALTNYHVVKECGSVKAAGAVLQVLALDKANDLALLRHPTPRKAIAVFRDGRGIRVGDSVIAVGFPLQDLLNASEPNVTTGTVSALSGADDDRRFLRLTAPVQPGNSGGPLLDLSGNVVGVIVAALFGGETQNVNFALSEGVVRTFLDSEAVPYQTATSGTDLKPADVAEKSQGLYHRNRVLAVDPVCSSRDGRIKGAAHRRADSSGSRKQQIWH